MCRSSDPADSNALARERDDRGPNNLFVGCVPAGMDEGSLRALFEPSGQVADCHLVFDRATGQHRGFGFVRMAHEQGALDAMQRLHNFTVTHVLIARHLQIYAVHVCWVLLSKAWACYSPCMPTQPLTASSCVLQL